MKTKKLRQFVNIFFKEDIVLEALVEYDEINMTTTSVDVPIAAGEEVKTWILEDRGSHVDFILVGRDAPGLTPEVYGLPREMFELINDRFSDCPF